MFSFINNIDYLNNTRKTEEGVHNNKKSSLKALSKNLFMEGYIKDKE